MSNRREIGGADGGVDAATLARPGERHRREPLARRRPMDESRRAGAGREQAAYRIKKYCRHDGIMAILSARRGHSPAAAPRPLGILACDFAYIMKSSYSAGDFGR